LQYLVVRVHILYCDSGTREKRLENTDLVDSATSIYALLVDVA